MATFLYLIDYAARLLRPISILTRIAETGLRVIEHLYPAPTEAPDIAVAALAARWARRTGSLLTPERRKSSSRSSCRS